MTSPAALFRLRLPALLTALATALLLPGCLMGTSTYSYAASADGGSSWASSPLAMLMPAPTLADLSDATLEVPEICALTKKSARDATRGATGKVTFKDGRATPAPGSEAIDAAVTSLKEVTSSVIDGRPVAIATISCFYGGAYSDDGIVAYDSDLSLVAVIDPKTLDGDLEGQVYEVTIDAVSANAVTGDLVLSIGQIGVYGDEDYHAALHSGSAKLLYAWAGGARGYTLSDAVYMAGGRKVRMPRTEDVQAFVDAVIAHNDDEAAQWAPPRAGLGPQASSSGEALAGGSAGRATVVGVLIDPMAQGAHAETDLAALGVFGQRYLDRIYAAYHEVSPLAEGWRERVGLHSWHILMIHAFLFGGGYGGEAVAVARQYL